MQITAKTLPSEEAATRNLLEARRNMSRQRGGRTNAGQNEGAHKLSHEAGGVRVLHRFGSGSVCEGKTRERDVLYEDTTAAEVISYSIYFLPRKPRQYVS